jgi:cysteine desulfurase
MTARVYLDWNATAPLRPEARAAMIAAMDLVGNPSSVHAEGRAAKALIERRGRRWRRRWGRRGRTSSSPRARPRRRRWPAPGAGCICAASSMRRSRLVRDRPCRSMRWPGGGADPARTALQLANSETGVMQDLPEGLAVSDLTQAFGKLPFAFNWLGCDMGLSRRTSWAGRRGRRAGDAARAGPAAAQKGRRAGDGPPRRAPRT